MKKLLINLLLRLLFRESFAKPYDKERHLRKLMILNKNNDIWDYFPQRYTRLYKGYFLIPEKESELRLITKGRMLEISDLLESMESAEKDIETYKKMKTRMEAMTKQANKMKGIKVKYLVNKKY